MKISIIVPAYNEQDNIIKTLKSIANQTYSNIEVLVIDDGSSDCTKEKTLKFIEKDSRFFYFYKSNGGVSSARNLGLRKAKGEYVAFLDADDAYETNFVSRMVSEIQKQNSDACYCGYSIIDNNIKKKVQSKFINKDILYNYLAYQVKASSTSWLINLDFIKKNKIYFREGTSWGEDTEFYAQILSVSTNICFVNEYLVNYIKRDNQKHLSDYSIEKIDLDVKLYKNLLKISGIQMNQKNKDILKYYRLQGQIIYRLLAAFSEDVSNETIIEYYLKYKDYLIGNKLVNGFKSIKLFINKAILVKKINKL